MRSSSEHPNGNTSNIMGGDLAAMNEKNRKNVWLKNIVMFRNDRITYRRSKRGIDRKR